MTPTEPLYVMMSFAALLVVALVLVAGYLANASAHPLDHAPLARPSWRRSLGVLATSPLPFAGYAFPLAAPLALLAVVLPGRAPWARSTKLLVALGVLGAVAVGASGTLHGVEVSSLGVFSFAAFALFLAAAARTTDGEDDAAQLLFWVALGTTTFYLVFGTERTDTVAHLWKYGIGVTLGFVVVYLASRHRRLWPTVVTVFALGALSIVFGFRSHGLICLVAVLIVIMLKGRRLSGRSLAVRMLLTFAGVLALSRVLPALIGAGAFGEAVRRRTMADEMTGASLLLAGRVEPPLSIAAVLTHPLLGWGSADAIDQRTLSLGVRIADVMGLSSPSLYIDTWRRSDGHISLHSILFDSWVQGGVVAALLPLTLIAIFALAIVRSQGRFAALTVLVSVQGIWDLLFSPWGVNRPVLFATAAVLACWSLVGTAGSTDREPGAGPRRTSLPPAPSRRLHTVGPVRR